MNKLIKTVLVFISMAIIATIVYSMIQISQKNESQSEVLKPSNEKTNTTILSIDGESIIASGNGIILSVDNQTIFDWFKNKSQLCEGNNLTSTPDREMFCNNREYFREKTKFKSIVTSSASTVNPAKNPIEYDP